MLRRLITTRFLAPDEAATGGAATEPTTGTVEPEVKPESQPTATFTQSDVDRIVNERLTRERKTEADKRKQADMTESEKLKAALAEAEGKVTEADKRASARMTLAEARLQSIAVGVKPDRIDALLKLADLSAVEMGDDGEPNATSIKKAITTALGLYPEFKIGAAAKGGADYSAGAGETPLTEAAIMAMTPAELSQNMTKIEGFYRGRKAVT